jgi:sterol desaturase/sphingolipid hydroxylase (fatty acid hydroxylase superfamily)|uniref:Fatty acid hydroxylase domain-containing protein n=1 Tax=Phaeodactylum tricornutum TaxID=2850 RepID=A0A8J9SSD0_PHATR
MLVDRVENNEKQQQQMASSSDAMSDSSLSDDEIIEHVVHGKEPKSTYELSWVSNAIAWSGALVWPLMLTVPLLLSSMYSPISYRQVFPESWYVYDTLSNCAPKPLGLVLGILAVAVGQVFVWIFFYLFKFGYLGTDPRSIQSKGAREYIFREGLLTHIGQPEGFVLLIGYLAITWMLKLMPQSYYSFEGTIQYKELFMCLVLQDGIQYTMHILEHIVSPAFYQMSHKPHHRFTNPRLFDAFNGSLMDTFCMIIIPLFVTANLVRHCNVWTYMAFGSSYACWLTLIHSEYVFPWDGIFRKLGLGTPADHHVHHKFFKFNYGHLFMWFDQLGGTYRDPSGFAPRVFRENV